MTGNKGSVSVRFNYEDTSFAFLNSHLESGQNATAERMEHVRQIFNDSFNDFGVCMTQDKCFHDYKCFFGDMNFRIDLSNYDTRELIDQKKYAQL